MERSFTMSRAEVVDADPAELKAAILRATGNAQGVESIMRSLERMGVDESIDRFELSEVQGNRRYGGAAPAAWRVRAERRITTEPGP